MGMPQLQGATYFWPLSADPLTGPLAASRSAPNPPAGYLELRQDLAHSSHSHTPLSPPESSGTSSYIPSKYTFSTEN